MPIRLYDFECSNCEKIFESFADVEETSKECIICGHKAKRIVSLGRVYLGNESANWISSVLDVVDKDSRKPHVREFIKNPTRANYKAWMKGEGLRPLDSNVNGAPPVRVKPPGPDAARIRKDLIEKHIARRRIEVR